MVVRGGIEPPTQGFSVLCSTDWAIEPWRSWRELNPRSPLWQRGVLTATLQDLGCGSRTWTYDLQVMSLTSYQLLYPAINGGGGGIRTPAHLSAPVGFQDRSLQPDLGTPPMVDHAGLEPATNRLWAGSSDQLS